LGHEADLKSCKTNHGRQEWDHKWDSRTTRATKQRRTNG